MLRPKDIAATDFPMAVKPTLGYELQLYVSTQLGVEPGMLAIQAANSGVYTPSAADNAALAAAPMELVAELEGDVNCGASDMVMTVTGTDANGQPLTGTATFKVPSYSSFTERVFPKGYAVEVTTASGNPFKTVTAVTVQNDAVAAGVNIALFGVPALGTFRKIGCKTQLNFDPKVPLPHSVQCGRDLSAFIKAGEIPEGTLDITAKIPTFSDGLARVNGRRVTGMIKEVKEDKLDTMHVFMFGLIMTSKVSNGESVDPSTLSATAKYEDIGIVLAQGAS
ncbi:MAG TPA: hypothetical protein VN829_16230 [Dongiaceae bacterium]|nr:hypothetical protein [Dongiaceae bacterium]